MISLKFFLFILKFVENSFKFLSFSINLSDSNLRTSLVNSLEYISSFSVDAGIKSVKSDCNFPHDIIKSERSDGRLEIAEISTRFAHSLISNDSKDVLCSIPSNDLIYLLVK